MDFTIKLWVYFFAHRHNVTGSTPLNYINTVPSSFASTTNKTLNIGLVRLNFCSCALCAICITVQQIVKCAK